MAAIPAINIVKVATRRIEGLNIGWEERKGWKRTSRKTPAVTRVEEWTKAETGVGAAMAAGSQEEKGIWALFVMAATIIEKIISVE